nr:MAG TPA: hypothetical protein [Caudoviricetes sp.]
MLYQIYTSLMVLSGARIPPPPRGPAALPPSTLRRLESRLLLYHYQSCPILSCLLFLLSQCSSSI